MATTAKPAVIPVIRPAKVEQATGFRYVDLTVRGFKPSAAGPVQVVVVALTKPSPVELGRFGIYPELGFTASDPEKAQRFGLSIPPDVRLDGSTRLLVRIVPGLGSGEGAAVEVEAGTLR